MEFSNLKNIEQIENNINLLIHNLNIYNDKASTYKENSKLLNQALSGNFKYSLPTKPTKLQMSEIVDMDGKPIKEKSFNDLFNETSNLYQNLLMVLNKNIYHNIDETFLNIIDKQINN